jgi:hypothetical protein
LRESNTLWSIVCDERIEALIPTGMLVVDALFSLICPVIQDLLEFLLIFRPLDFRKFLGGRMSATRVLSSIMSISAGKLGLKSFEIILIVVETSLPMSSDPAGESTQP